MERGRDILLVAHDDIQIGRDHGRFTVAEGTFFRRLESFNHATIFRDFLAFLNQ